MIVVLCVQWNSYHPWFLQLYRLCVLAYVRVRAKVRISCCVPLFLDCRCYFCLASLVSFFVEICPKLYFISCARARRMNGLAVRTKTKIKPAAHQIWKKRVVIFIWSSRIRILRHIFIFNRQNRMSALRCARRSIHPAYRFDRVVMNVLCVLCDPEWPKWQKLPLWMRRGASKRCNT